MKLEHFKIWMAAFYEGEGYTSNDVSNNNRIRLGIDQNDPTPLHMAQKIWGGRVRKRVRKSPASNKICTVHCWVLNHHDALTFLADIKPYMLIPYKINQMNTVLEKAANGLNRRFQCKYCDKDYASPSGRRRHEKAAHLTSDISSI